MTSADVATVYRDDKGEFRYHIEAPNNEIIAEGEAYEHKQDIFDMLHRHFPEVRIVDETVPS